MKTCLVALVSILALVSQGCSTFKSSNQAVVISATDPAADIYVDGQLVGRGTATADLKRNRSHAILARVGDRAGTAQIGTQISATGILDIVGGFFWLVPFIGIATPGFHDLDTTAVSIAIPAPQTAPQQVQHTSYPNQ